MGAGQSRRSHIPPTTRGDASPRLDVDRKHAHSSSAHTCRPIGSATIERAKSARAANSSGGTPCTRYACATRSSAAPTSGAATRIVASRATPPVEPPCKTTLRSRFVAHPFTRRWSPIGFPSSRTLWARAVSSARGHELAPLPPQSPLAGQAGVVRIAADGTMSGAHDPRSDGRAVGVDLPGDVP